MKIEYFFVKHCYSDIYNCGMLLAYTLSNKNNESQKFSFKVNCRYRSFLLGVMSVEQHKRR